MSGRGGQGAGDVQAALLAAGKPRSAGASNGAGVETAAVQPHVGQQVLIANCHRESTSKLKAASCSY
jgi:hypothetical protein